MGRPEDASGNESLWMPRDPIEEAERVERHLAMAKEMLVEKEVGQDTFCQISFNRLVEQDGMQTLLPGDHIGTLLGVEEDGESVLLVGNLKTYLIHVEEGAEKPDINILVGESDFERVPVREIKEFFGATATPDAWEKLAEGC